MKRKKNNNIKPDISDSVSVYKGRNDNYRSVYSNSNYFSDADYFLLRDDGKCLTITKHRMEILHQAQKKCKTKYGYSFQFISTLPIGKFKFDAQESDEDVAKIYYKQLNHESKIIE